MSTQQRLVDIERDLHPAAEAHGAGKRQPLDHGARADPGDGAGMARVRPPRSA